MGTILVIERARLSYPILGEPKSYKDDPKNPPRWGAGLWILKTDTATLKQIDDAIRAVAKETWPKNWEKVLEEVLLDKKACCWLDGKRRGEDAAEAFWTLTAYRDATKGPPVVYDRDMTPIYKEDRSSFHPGKAGRLYAGCVVKGKVEIWAQDNQKGGKGMRAGLLGIQFVKDDTAFGGGAMPTAEGFGEIAEGADADDMSE